MRNGSVFATIICLWRASARGYGRKPWFAGITSRPPLLYMSGCATIACAQQYSTSCRLSDTTHDSKSEVLCFTTPLCTLQSVSRPKSFSQSPILTSKPQSGSSLTQIAEVLCSTFQSSSVLLVAVQSKYSCNPKCAGAVTGQGHLTVSLAAIVLVRLLGTYRHLRGIPLYTRYQLHKTISLGSTLVILHNRTLPSPYVLGRWYAVVRHIGINSRQHFDRSALFCVVTAPTRYPLTCGWKEFDTTLERQDYVPMCGIRI